MRFDVKRTSGCKPVLGGDGVENACGRGLNVQLVDDIRHGVSPFSGAVRLGLFIGFPGAFKLPQRAANVASRAGECLTIGFSILPSGFLSRKKSASDCVWGKPAS